VAVTNRRSIDQGRWARGLGYYERTGHPECLIDPAGVDSGRTYPDGLADDSSDPEETLAYCVRIQGQHRLDSIASDFRQIRIVHALRA
jgi:hypothetical protein